MIIDTFASPNDLARAAAEHFVTRSNEAIDQKGFATVALSGGSTPKILYGLLSDPNEPFHDQVPWTNTHFFWSDERHVPPDHPESNYRMAHEALLSRVPVPASNVHRVHSENPDASQAAAEYEQTIVQVTKQSLPKLDVILLGLGTDGHTASLFPGSEVLHETKRLVAAPWVEKLNTYRITVTLPLINNGASIVFLVSGTEKSQIVKEVLEGPKKYPAQYVKPTHGQLRWMIEADAKT